MIVFNNWLANFLKNIANSFHKPMGISFSILMSHPQIINNFLLLLTIQISLACLSPSFFPIQ